MKASASYVRKLRNDCDESQVERALEDGLISARQAASAMKFIRLANEIRANPIRAQLIQVGSHFVGEVEFLDGTWIGRRYGKDYPSGCSFASEEEAHDFVVAGAEGN